MIGGEDHDCLQSLEVDGRYRSASVPGLALQPARLWQMSSSPTDPVFDVERSLPRGWSYQPQKGIEWDDGPFNPRPALEPRAVTFAEFASWCPRAKFEGDGERTTVGGHLGSRNVIGMLLRTFGLVEAVKLLSPAVWVTGLKRVEEWCHQNAERKARAWQIVRQAAARLRRKHRIERMAIIGDLLRPEPLHFWSELSLVVWNMPEDPLGVFRMLRSLQREFRLNLIDPARATEVERRGIASEARDVD